jgi:hypothetical protein
MGLLLSTVRQVDICEQSETGRLVRPGRLAHVVFKTLCSAWFAQVQSGSPKSSSDCKLLMNSR